MSNDTVTFKLSKPIEYNGKTITEFTFREAETGDLMVADSVKGETSKIVAILACMADTPLPVFKKIKARDLTAIMAKTAALLGESEAASRAVDEGVEDALTLAGMGN